MNVEHPNRMWTVYGLFADDVMVYVGCSGDLKGRLAEHEKNHGDQITAKVLASFANRPDALTYERHIIKRVRPPLNMAANPDFYAKHEKWRESPTLVRRARLARARAAQDVSS